MAKRPLNPFYLWAKNKDQLTEKELKVVRLVCLGCHNLAVATILDRSTHTVGNHKISAMRKLGVRNAAGLTRRALQLGVVSLHDYLAPEELQRLTAAGIEAPEDYAPPKSQEPRHSQGLSSRVDERHTPEEET